VVIADEEPKVEVGVPVEDPIGPIALEQIYFGQDVMIPNIDEPQTN
jgi:hypothetical protein